MTNFIEPLFSSQMPNHILHSESMERELLALVTIYRRKGLSLSRIAQVLDHVRATVMKQTNEE